jgi:hypothetical protein
MRPVVRLLEKALVGAPAKGRRKLLVRASGEYCLFCEAPLATGKYPPRVHMRSSGYQLPDNAGTMSVPVDVLSTWANTLLCCPACNDAKGDVPDWYDTLKTLAATQVGLDQGARLADGKMEEGPALVVWRRAAETWIWPDSAEDGKADGTIVFQGDDTWNMLKLVRVLATQRELEQAGLVQLSPTDKSEEWVNKKLNGVWVVPADGMSEASRLRALATIRGFNLNYANPSSNDRRAHERTRTWDEAEQAIAGIEKSLLAMAADSSALFAFSAGEETAALRETIRKTGFWTVWARMLVARGEKWVQAGFDFWAVRAFLTALLVQYEADNVPELPNADMGDGSVQGQPEIAQGADETESMLDEGGGGSASSGSSSSSPQQEEAEAEDEEEEEDEDETLFLMVIDGTDVDRLPKILGGPL